MNQPYVTGFHLVIKIKLCNMTTSMIFQIAYLKIKTWYRFLNTISEITTQSIRILNKKISNCWMTKERLEIKALLKYISIALCQAAFLLESFALKHLFSWHGKTWFLFSMISLLKFIDYFSKWSSFFDIIFEYIMIHFLI